MAGGLPHAIVETTDEQTSRYLTGLAQQQDTTWAYQHPDGLGSVRQLTDASAEVTLLQSYDPFGNLVAQSGPGSSGFGYTGEQEDANTGLVFLRARYYDPSVGRFVSKDPWPGTVSHPNTLHGFSYVANNPILRRDPSGRDYVPSWDRYTCDDPHSSNGYVYHYDKATGSWGLWPCLAHTYQDAIAVGVPGYPYPDRNGGPPGGETQTQFQSVYLPLSPQRSLLPDYKIANELKDANGYLEGRVVASSIIACVVDIVGEEIVYDFETLERQKFTYTEAGGFSPVPGLAFSLGGRSETFYGGFLWGFSRESDITNDYQGIFRGANFGISLSAPFAKAIEKLGVKLAPHAGVSTGISIFDNPHNPSFYGRAGYISYGASAGSGKLSGLLFLSPDASAALTEYVAVEGSKRLYLNNELQMLRDVDTGNSSPVPRPLSIPIPFNNIYGEPLSLDFRDAGVAVGANTFARNGTPIH